MANALPSTSPLSTSTSSSPSSSSSSSLSPSTSSGNVSITSAFDSRFLKGLKEDKERKQRLGIGFRSGPFKHLIPLRDDADGEEGKKRHRVAHRINTREEPEQEEDDEDEEEEDEEHHSAEEGMAAAKQAAASEGSAAASAPVPAAAEPSPASSPVAVQGSEHPPHSSSPLLDLAQSSAAAAPALVKDGESSVSQQIIGLITRALRMQGEMLTEYATHVLLADEGQAEKDGAKPLEFFAARFRTELLQSHEELKQVQALLQQKAEEGEDSLSLTSLLAPVLGPLSNTFSTLIPSSLALAPAFAPLASSLPSSTDQLAASLLAAKRGRGRLQKCEKHRRWKKRCPPDCPDKPINNFVVDGEDDGEDDEDDDDEEETRAKREVSAKRRWTDDLARGSAAGEAADDRKVKRVCEATVVQTAVPTQAFQSVVPIAPAVIPQQVEAVRAYEPTIAKSVRPSMSLAMTSPTPQRSTVVMGRSHGVVQHAPSAVQSIPLTPAPTTTLYTAQPIVLPSHQPTQLFAYSSSPPSFAPSNFHHGSTTLVTLDQLNAMQAAGQQQAASFRLVQQPAGAAYPLRAQAAGQAVNVIYQAARPQPGYAFTTAASQGFHLQ